MSNPKRVAPIASSPCPGASEGRAFERTVRRDQPSSPALERSTTGVSINPFASFAGLPGEAGAETKHYEVPRELIEIARATASSREPVGALTPIAPRPSPELAASLHAYAALVSKASVAPSSPRAAPEVMRAPSVAREAGAHDSAEGAALPTRPSRGPGAALGDMPDFRAGVPSQAWPLYAGLILALGYCVHWLSSL